MDQAPDLSNSERAFEAILKKATKNKKTPQYYFFELWFFFSRPREAIAVDPHQAPL